MSNGGWIDGNTADGIRLSLANEYSHIYVYNLRGNQRTVGEFSRKEGGKIFGSGSRNTVAIFIGVKDTSRSQPCTIQYRDVGDYLSREEKLAAVAGGSLTSLDWVDITPNEHGDWITQRDDRFLTWPVIGGKNGGERIFNDYSTGVVTARDAWVYNFSRANSDSNVRRMIENYRTLAPQKREPAEQQHLTYQVSDGPVP